jgi:hypothetical protein
MEPYSSPHHPTPYSKSPRDGADLVAVPGSDSHSGQTNLDPRIKTSANRISQSSVSAALAVANAGLQNVGSFPVRFPGEDGGHSLAEVAQRDLDAALQLLADRAQYITGAGGAAIALRRDGMNDLLCRASAGSNAPELGALLSTEFGLSGESVRTRRALRCDDAERDARVNREVCRELGIASVVVMPVVDDDQVLGVFELFSGKANAFGERDLSALQRLSEMVETAVKLARAAESVTAHGVAERDTEPEVAVAEAAALPAAEFPVEIEEPNVGQPVSQEIPSPVTLAQKGGAPVISVPSALPAVPVSDAASAAKQIPPLKAAAVPKPLFWSVALSASGEAAQAVETNPLQEDQNHVPPVLRNLRKCEACGFPVSTGRTLCVECEEKKWRGLLKPQTASKQAAAIEATTPVQELRNEPAQDMATAELAEKAADLKPNPSDLKPSAVQPNVVTKADTAKAVEAIPTVVSAVDASAAPEFPASTNSSAPDFAFSAGMEPSQSWLAANKYILGAIVVAAAAIAAFVFLR